MLLQARDPVLGILKQASIHMKREEYADAVRFVRRFRDEVGSV
jgi:hypothetical protein